MPILKREGACANFEMRRFCAPKREEDVLKRNPKFLGLLGLRWGMRYSAKKKRWIGKKLKKQGVLKEESPFA